ncbi:MAG: heme-binding domain-containing protein [Actinobacteria bacterium]|nr:heme-binding domain-containing protein [Actinomycetota bacterium]
MTKTGARPKRSIKKIALWTIVGLIALFVLIQFVPYGRDHTQQPATNPFKWSSPEAEAIAKKSCYDCHSNETKWWWGVKIAPASWLAQHDIDDAQKVFNFSEWDGSLTTEGLQNAINDNMPPLQFTLLHPSAKLSDADKQTLVDGFQASLADNGSSGTTTPAATPTPTATATTASSGSDATAVINAQCSRCHSATVALQFQASSADEAQALIDQMIQKGATVTPAEEQTLIDYFTR